MALIILEGMDRTGKSSVAHMFERQGYELIHMSAPTKGLTSDLFLEEMMDLVSLGAHKDIVLDRSYYGEACIWPKVYGRESLMDEQGLEIIREIEAAVGTKHILMHDPSSEGHWQRCVENNEPLTRVQFVKARSLYSGMADKYEFDRKTLKDYPEAEQPLPEANKPAKQLPDSSSECKPSDVSANQTKGDQAHLLKSKEQLKLERANIINEVLDKRLIKGKGPMYDEVERSVRHFLNNELGKILGTTTATPGLSNEEIELLKFFCKRLKDKETQ